MRKAAPQLGKNDTRIAPRSHQRAFGDHGNHFTGVLFAQIPDLIPR